MSSSRIDALFCGAGNGARTASGTRGRLWALIDLLSPYEEIMITTEGNSDGDSLLS